MPNNKDHLNLLPDGFNYRAAGCCMLAAQIMARELVLRGIMDFTVVEGYIKTPESSGRGYMHTWIVLNDRIYDPTLGQFDGGEPIVTKRVIEVAYTPEEYLSEFLINTNHPEMFFRGREIPKRIEFLIQKSYGQLLAAQANESDCALELG